MKYIFRNFPFGDACFEFLEFLNFIYKSDGIYLYVVRDGYNIECIGGTSNIDNLDDFKFKSFIKDNQSVYGAGILSFKNDCVAVPLTFDGKVYGYLYTKNSPNLVVDDDIVEYLSLVFYIYLNEKNQNGISCVNETTIRNKIEKNKNGCVAVIKIENVPNEERSFYLSRCHDALKQIAGDIIVDYDLIVLFIHEDKVATGCKLKELLDIFKGIIDFKIVYSAVEKNCVEQCYSRMYSAKQNEIIYADNNFVETSKADRNNVRNGSILSDESSDPFSIEISADGGFANYFDSKDKKGVNSNEN